MFPVCVLLLLVASDVFVSALGCPFFNVFVLRLCLMSCGDVYFVLMCIGYVPRVCVFCCCSLLLMCFFLLCFASFLCVYWCV